MAHRTLLSSLSRGLLRPCAFCIQHPRLACFLLICIVFLLTAVSAMAQTSQRVYASVPATTTTTSQILSFTKDATGALSLVGAPIASPLEGGQWLSPAKRNSSSSSIHPPAKFQFIKSAKPPPS